jgi:hypothetical protein
MDKVSSRQFQFTITSIALQLNSVALVRERTLPTERPPLVGEVLRIEGVAWSVQRIPTVLNLDFLERTTGLKTHEESWSV